MGAILSSRGAVVLGLILLLAGCDAVLARVGVPDLARQEAARDAEARAVGAACRQSQRALEDCYARAPRLPWAAVLEGWRDLDGYLRDQAPTPVPAAPAEPVPAPTPDGAPA